MGCNPRHGVRLLRQRRDLFARQRAKVLGPFALATSRAHRHYSRAHASAAAPTQPDRAVLAGTVERVTFHNAESGFCVLRIKARAHRDLVTIVSHAATIAAGEWITGSGEWVNDRGQRWSS